MKYHLIYSNESIVIKSTSEKFEDNKVVIKNCKSKKNRKYEYDRKMKTDKNTNHNNTVWKPRD